MKTPGVSGAPCPRRRQGHPMIDPDEEGPPEPNEEEELPDNPNIETKWWRGWRCSYTRHENVGEERLRQRKHLVRLAAEITTPLKAKMKASVSVSTPWGRELALKRQRYHSKAERAHYKKMRAE